MPVRRKARFEVLKPNLQIAFFYRLRELRQLYLFDALKKTVERLDVRELDGELASFVNSESLRRVASFGLRGETFFPVPCSLQANPFLLGYYRLLYGHSQKAFYGKGPFGRFRTLEERGNIPDRVRSSIAALCQSLIRTGETLVDSIDELSLAAVHDLQLLTIGPQFRGSENTRIGQAATGDVFKLMKRMVRKHVKQASDRVIQIINNAGRRVLIEFASDPDIKITEQLESQVRPLVSIEIKGGADVSNIHNRIGEAEKSHQKAKRRGFFEFWTILGARVDPDMARRESPTTTHFFDLRQIRRAGSADHRRLRELLGSVLSIRV